MVHSGTSLMLMEPPGFLPILYGSPTGAHPGTVRTGLHTKHGQNGLISDESIYYTGKHRKHLTFTLKLSGSSYPHHKEFWTR